MPRAFDPGPPMTTWRPGPSGPSRCRSGWPPRADDPARPARPARTRGRICGRAEQPGRKVQRERRLADAGRTDEQHRVGRPTRIIDVDRTQRGRVPPGPDAVHGAGQAVSASAGAAAALRVVRRFGAAAGASASVEALGAVGVGARRRRLARACGASARRPEPPGRPHGVGARRVRVGVGAALRVVRRFGAAAGAWPRPRRSAAAVVASSCAAGAALRVVRRFGASGLSLRGLGVDRRAIRDLGAGRLAAGFWATCARSMASSSGGTSLHGSLDERGAAARSRGRPHRGAPVRTVIAGCPPRRPGCLARLPWPPWFGLAGPATDVRVAVDAAATAAAVALAVHGRLVGRPTAARPATALAALATAPPRAAAAPRRCSAMRYSGISGSSKSSSSASGARFGGRRRGRASPAANPRPSRTGSCAGRAVRRPPAPRPPRPRRCPRRRSASTARGGGARPASPRPDRGLGRDRGHLGGGGGAGHRPRRRPRPRGARSGQRRRRRCRRSRSRRPRRVHPARRDRRA